MLAFKATQQEDDLIRQIARRASALSESVGVAYRTIEAAMDVEVCHSNGCPLDLPALLAADDTNFSHDVFGIRRHLNRRSGALENCFTPRYALTEHTASGAPERSAGG